VPLGSSLADAVFSCVLPVEEDFRELSESAHLEDLGKGRRGAVLTRIDATGGVPFVRTTTRYGRPAQPFRAVHERLARRIQERAGLPVAFDNALIEHYTDAYRTMGSHSDQALDLAEESSIAVFSCYENPEAAPSRKLVFETKGPEPETFEIPLVHHGVVAFSVATNRRLRHKIVRDAPDAPAGAPDNPWLGLTFRTSATLLRFRDGHAHLPDGTRLTVADEEQARAFYRLRRRENEETDFVYPPLTYTVSPSDLLPPSS